MKKSLFPHLMGFLYCLGAFLIELALFIVAGKWQLTLDQNNSLSPLPLMVLGSAVILRPLLPMRPRFYCSATICLILIAYMAFTSSVYHFIRLWAIAAMLVGCLYDSWEIQRAQPGRLLQRLRTTKSVWFYLSGCCFEWMLLLSYLAEYKLGDLWRLRAGRELCLLSLCLFVLLLLCLYVRQSGVRCGMALLFCLGFGGLYLWYGMSASIQWITILFLFLGMGYDIWGITRRLRVDA